MGPQFPGSLPKSSLRSYSYLCLWNTVMIDSITERNHILYPSQVCRHWRSTVLSTGALWLFISFQCEQQVNIIHKSDCAWAWLSRSTQCPLSIKIVADMDSQDRVEAALQILIPHCTRWKAIDSGLIVLESRIWSHRHRSQ